MIIIKCTSNGDHWYVYHRSVTLPNGIFLNLTAAAEDNSTRMATAPTASVFTVETDAMVNYSGRTYVAYLFAHDTSSTGIIQCGSFTMPGGGGGSTIELGWEPQFILLKDCRHTQNWWMLDTMTGYAASTGADPFTGGKAAGLWPNLADPEYSGGNYGGLRSTGFNWATNFNYGDNNTTYIYMAIRRPNKPPTSGTQVYNAIARTGTGAAATVNGVGFPPDMVMSSNRSASWGNGWIYDRLRNNANVGTSGYAIEASAGTEFSSFDMNGVTLGATTSGTINYTTSYINHFLKRAPGFFDVVCYTGNDSDQSLSHNLGVKPQLIFTKSRTAAPYSDWYVYSETTSAYTHLILNSTAAVSGFDGGNFLPGQYNRFMIRRGRVKFTYTQK